MCEQSQNYKHEYVTLNNAFTAQACMISRNAESPELAIVASAMLVLELKQSIVLGTLYCISEVPRSAMEPSGGERETSPFCTYFEWHANLR